MTNQLLGVEGGFDAQAGPEEFEEKYQIYLHPTKQYIPYPNPALPEKVLILTIYRFA